MDQLNTLFARLSADGARLAGAAIKLRRRLHQYPETGNREFRTTAQLKIELQKLNLIIHDGHAPTGLWAQLDTGRPGPVVAIRTDIDALPVSEHTGLSYASRNDGVMHACGHDVHMAILVGVARLLARHKHSLKGQVKFICQPAEEIPPGGARPLIAAGVLDRPKVDAILALHVDPKLPVGSIGIRDGVSMASVYDFDLKIVGRSGHAALPHEAVDAITVAAQVIMGLQQVISRKVDPISPGVISFGIIRGGTVRNVIPGEVYIQGTARSLDPALKRKLPSLIRKTASGIARGLGARAEVVSLAEYPPLTTDPRVNRFIARAFRAVYPKGKIHEIPRILGSEDFACYLEKVPGSMFRLGVRNRDIGADKPWHHPAFIVDEKAIEIGIITMAATAADILMNWNGGSR